jgi:hypothetical protein
MVTRRGLGGYRWRTWSLSSSRGGFAYHQNEFRSPSANAREAGHVPTPQRTFLARRLRPFDNAVDSWVDDESFARTRTTSKVWSAGLGGRYGVFVGYMRYPTDWAATRTATFMTDATIVTVAVAAWLVFAASSILPIVWVRHCVRERSRTCQGRCPTCGYDLRATPDRASEWSTNDCLAGSGRLPIPEDFRCLSHRKP